MCNFLIISKTNSGKIYFCPRSINLSMLFKNISKGYKPEEFLEFKSIIDSEKVEAFFLRFPGEEKIHFKSGYDGLFLSFSLQEIEELRKLMDEAWLKYSLYSYSYCNQN